MSLKDCVQINFVDLDHYRIIPYLANKLAAKSYLEIGCADNQCFDKVPVVHKVGVDPERGGTVRMTSDEFFSSNKEKFDLIFVDGLHKYEQVYKDLENSFKSLQPGGIVVMHDILPSNRFSAAPNKKEKKKKGVVAWNGDVWRAAFDMAQKDDIVFRAVRCLHGVGIIRVGRNHNPLKLTPTKEWEFYRDHWHLLPHVDSFAAIDSVFFS